MTSHDIGPQRVSSLFPPSSSDLSSTRAAADCPQCHKLFNLSDREPYVLGSTCFHSVCLSCLQKGTRADGTFECTLCHKPGPYVRNFALLKIIKERDRMREIPLLSARSDDVYSEDGDVTNVESVPSTPKVAICAECYDDEVAVNHCGDCRRWLCALHSAAHKKGAATYGHRLESMEESKADYTSSKPVTTPAATKEMSRSASLERGVSSTESTARSSAVVEEEDQDKVVRCPKHKGVVQDMFCVTEQVLVCPKCALTDHRAHEVKDSQEVFQEQRTAIEKGLRKVRSRLNRLNAIIAAIGEKAIQGGSHYMKTKAEIESVFTQLTILLKDRRAELEKSLDEVNAKRTMALANHKETLMAEKQRLEQLAEQTQLTLEGTDADDARVLTMSGMLLQALKSAADGASMAGGDAEDQGAADSGAATSTPGSVPSGSSSAVHRAARPNVVTVPSKDPKAPAPQSKEKDPSKELLDISVAFVCKDRPTMEALISRLGQLLVHTPSRTKTATTSGASSGSLVALPVDGVDVILAKNATAAESAEPSDTASSSGESKSTGDQLPLTARLAQSAALGLSSLLRQSPVRAAPILVAAAHGQLEVVQWLLDNQLAVQGETDSEGHTPLLLAAANGHLHLLSWLLKSRKARIQERDAKGNTALLLAARFGRLKVVQWLLTEGYSSIKEKNKEGQTALILAATHSTGFVHEYAEDGTFIQDKPSNGGPTYRWITERYGYAIPEDEQQQAERIFETKQEELQKKKKKSAVQQNPSRQSIQEAPESFDDDAAASYEGSEYSADTVSEYSSSNLNEPIFSARTVASVTSILDVSSARGANAKTNDVLAPFNSLRSQAPPSRTPRRKLREEVPDLPE